MLEMPFDPNIEYSLIYYYHRDFVLEEGVTYVVPGDGGSIKEYNKANNYGRDLDKCRPKLHFSPFSGWMNDPNGLIKIDDSYHMFYQYYPNANNAGPIHWGHAASKNLMDWIHLPVFLYPDESFEKNGGFGGMFSGSSLPLSNNEEDRFRVFLTHRDKSIKGTPNFKEYQIQVFPNKNLIEVDKINTIIKDKPNDFIGNDFRDPKVFLDSDGLYKMVLGSTYKQKPAILLYISKDLSQWDYHSVLYVAEEVDADSAECPNLFKIKDDYILIISYTGYTHRATGRKNLIYAMVGAFQNNIFTPKYSREVDFGTDFYALQGFFDTKGHYIDDKRLIAFGWNYNWGHQSNNHSTYCGEISLPLEMSIQKNQLIIKPTQEVYNKRLKKLFSILNIRNTFKQVLNNISSLEVLIDIKNSSNNDSFSIVLEDEKGNGAKINISLGKVSIINISNREKIKYTSITGIVSTLQLFFDCGILEVYINDGETMGTRRFQHFRSVRHICINGIDIEYKKIEGYSY